MFEPLEPAVEGGTGVVGFAPNMPLLMLVESAGFAPNKFPVGVAVREAAALGGALDPKRFVPLAAAGWPPKIPPLTGGGAAGVVD